MVVLEPFEGRCIGVLTASVQNAEELKLKLPSWPFAMIDARYVTGERQLATAACVCLVAERDGKMLTKSLSTELLYRISGSTNVAESLKTFGLNQDSSRVAIVAFDVPAEQPDMTALRKMYKVPVEQTRVSEYILNVVKISFSDNFGPPGLSTASSEYDPDTASRLILRFTVVKTPTKPNTTICPSMYNPNVGLTVQYMTMDNRTDDERLCKPGGGAGNMSAAQSVGMAHLRRSEHAANTPFGGMTAGQLLDSSDKENAAMLGVGTHHLLSPNMPGRRDSLMSAGMLGGKHDDDNDDSEDEAPRGEKRTGRRKIRIEYIDDKSRRHITFSKRKAGIMKKVLLLVASETGHVYTFATPKLQPLITKPEGKNLIQACLNAPDIPAPEYQVSWDESVYEERSSTSGQASGIPVNYAAAMAGLAGFQYPTGQSSSAASAAFLNAAHYPAYAAQYNAALAAGYWPGTTSAAGAVSNPVPSSNQNPVSPGDRSLAGHAESCVDSSSTPGAAKPPPQQP
ncbi:hypothetical protein PSACC_01132 [Paramicrosporidium saccamoebae]|uniref:EKC/KEOPS complex subunit CGI121 n=1 Tax=Paramicrosporidium saccamoebae TaxID=1246581 RepID=A0A2H9TMT5_9FUNG|nr:hypothetical protein PSACC_01132 [Paramicrosporidium saccamoebae]